jgi:hypothetical protein
MRERERDWGESCTYEREERGMRETEVGWCVVTHTHTHTQHTPTCTETRTKLHAQQGA